jgi:acetyl esterase/lipase
MISNKIIQIALVSRLIVFIVLESSAQNYYPPKFDNAREEVYKTVDNIQLKLWIFNPIAHEKSDKRPAIVFFFGGGWQSGNPHQFEKHCEYLASRGMVAIIADYRVAQRHNVLANSCVADAKSAVRWIRKNAVELGVNPVQIVAGGGSAGGHLAVSTATLPNFDESNENLEISSIPNALILFNPVLILAPIKNSFPEFEKKLNPRISRLGAEPKSMSPYHNIKTGLPPSIIFHGEADTTVPFKTALIFTEKMNLFGNNCTLIGYKGEHHGFFNFGKKSNGPFIDTVHKMDQFLVSIGYLLSPPAILK